MANEATQMVWTLETLHVYLSEKIQANDRLYITHYEASQAAIKAAFDAQRLTIETALASVERATEKAELANEKRFESVNEFRATLSDQQRNLMPREESMTMHRASDEKIAALKESYDKGHDALIGEIAAIRIVMSASAGKSAGFSTLWGIIVGAIGIIGLVVSIIINIVK